MDSIFETNYVNKQPLRKYEPLIRFNSEGKPQPKRPYQASTSLMTEKVSAPTPARTIEQTKTPVAKQNLPSISKQDEALKRKTSDPGMEPKRKQQKQTSIVNFFNKK